MRGDLPRPGPTHITLYLAPNSLHVCSVEASLRAKLFGSLRTSSVSNGTRRTAHTATYDVMSESDSLLLTAGLLEAMRRHTQAEALIVAAAHLA